MGTARAPRFRSRRRFRSRFRTPRARAPAETALLCTRQSLARASHAPHAAPAPRAPHARSAQIGPQLPSRGCSRIFPKDATPYTVVPRLCCLLDCRFSRHKSPVNRRLTACCSLRILSPRTSRRRGAPHPRPVVDLPIHCNLNQTCCNAIQTLLQVNSNNSSWCTF